MESNTITSNAFHDYLKKIMTRIYYFLLILLLSVISCEELLEIDLLPPKVSITFPINESTVHEMVRITCIATDNKGISKLTLWVDGAAIEGVEDTDEPFSLLWNTMSYENNSAHTITVRAEDTSGNITDSKPIILYVENSSSAPNQINFLHYKFKDNNYVLTWNASIDYDFASYTIYRSTFADMSDKAAIFITHFVRDTVYTVENPDVSKINYYQLCVQDTFYLKTISEILPVFNFYHGLAGLYPFSGNLEDESDYAIHGTPNSISFVSDRFGNPTSAGYFNGLNAFGEIPNSPETDFDAMSDSYTIAFWIKTFEPKRCFILEKWNGHINVPYPVLIWADTTICCGAVYDTHRKYESDFGNIADGKWHFIAFVVENSIQHINYYSDGVLFKTIPNEAMVPTNNALNYKVGRATLNDTRFFKGNIDDIFFYKRALSKNEISSLCFFTTH